jgi:hypothetical protein
MAEVADNPAPNFYKLRAMVIEAEFRTLSPEQRESRLSELVARLDAIVRGNSDD